MKKTLLMLLFISAFPAFKASAMIPAIVFPPHILPLPTPVPPVYKATAYNFMVRFYPRFMTFSSQEFPGSLHNQFQAPVEPMGPEYKAVVAINDDTLYDSALLNLTEQPQIVTIPPYQYTYSIIQVDCFGTVLDTPLKPTPSGGTYMLVGPNHSKSGLNIAGVTNIYMPYNWTTLAIRTDKYYNQGSNNYLCVTNAAENFRSNIAILPLTTWITNSSGGKTIYQSLSKFSAPVKTITDVAAQGFTERFLDVLQLATEAPSTAPLSKSDRDLIANFNKLYNAASTAKSTNALGMMLDGAKAAHNDIIANWKKHTIGNNWVYFNNIGNWGTNYLDRASGNEYIQYGNTAKTSYYAQAFTDKSTNLLVGTNDYTITFSSNQIPQCTRFWSITAYTPEDIELVSNEANKYVVASYTPGLVYGKDGSVTVYISNKAPTNSALTPNWLPTPTGNFSVMLRIYGPQGSATNATNTYIPPAVVQSR